MTLVYPAVNSVLLSRASFRGWLGASDAEYREYCKELQHSQA